MSGRRSGTERGRKPPGEGALPSRAPREPQKRRSLRDRRARTPAECATVVNDYPKATRAQSTTVGGAEVAESGHRMLSTSGPASNTEVNGNVAHVTRSVHSFVALRLLPEMENTPECDFTVTRRVNTSSLLWKSRTVPDVHKRVCAHTNSPCCPQGLHNGRCVVRASSTGHPQIRTQEHLSAASSPPNVSEQCPTRSRPESVESTCQTSRV